MSERETATGPAPRAGYLLAVACLLLLVLSFAAAVWGSDSAFLARHPGARDLPWAAADGPALQDEPDNRSFNDNIWQRNPALAYNGEALREGRLPAWNPWILAGVPYSANPLVAVYYPPNWLTAALPAPDRVLAVAALHVLLAGLFVLLYLRAVGLAAMPALFGGVGFAFSGWVAAHLHNTQLVATVVWIPLGLWAIERSMQDGRMRGRCGVAMATTLAMMATAGFAQFAVLGTATLVIYAACSWLARRRLSALRPLGGLLLAATLGALLAAPQLLTTFEFLPRAARGSRTVPDLQSERYRPGAWIGLVLPRALGDPMSAAPWQTQGLAPALLGEGPEHVPPLITNWSERTIYPGIVVLLLAMIGLASSWRRAALSLAAVAGSGVMMASVPACIALYGALPGFDVGAPARAVMLLSFTLPALAACGFSVLIASARARVSAVLLGTTAAMGATSGALAMIAPAAGWPPGLGTDLWALTATALSMAALLWLRRRGRIPATVFGLGLLLVALLDLLAYWIPVNLPVTKSRLYPTTPALEFLADELGHDRYLRVSDNRARAVADRPALFHCNQNVLYRLRDAQGYQAVTTLSYLRLWRPLASLWAPVGFAGIAAADADSLVLDVAGVRFLIAARPLAALAGREAYPPTGEKGELWIYHNPDALPRARLVPSARVVDDEEALRLLHAGATDPRAEVLVDQIPLATATDLGRPREEPTDRQEPAPRVRWLVDDDERLLWDVEADAPGYLVVADTWDPGWLAFRVDAGGARQRLPIVRAMTCFRAVPVARGRQRIEMIYRPAPVRTGFIISLVAAGCGAAWFAWRGQRRRRSARGSRATPSSAAVSR